MIFVKYVHLLVLFAMSVSAYSSYRKLFPEVSGNLAKITWAHAVNDQAYLKRTLASDIMMLEADVVMGTLINHTEIIPVMGHPPTTVSDLSLDMFLLEVDKFNHNELNKKKGIKLDYKSTDALVNSGDHLIKIYKNANYPIWINADILKGPINASDPTVDYKAIFDLASALPNTMLSIGWTTKYSAFDHGSYTKDQITAMQTLLKDNKIENSITFPVHAGMACENIDVMKDLLTRRDYTLTLWGSDSILSGKINITKTNKLIKTIGVDRIYVDLPDEIKKQLDLEVACP